MEKKAFQASKTMLTSSKNLIHFNPELKLVLMCDASSYGIGAVLAHRIPDGSERPIGFASTSLSVAQRNYSQLKKEALAIVFGVQRFPSYLVGHHFELVTDFCHIYCAGVYFCTLVHSISFISMYISLFFVVH